jgi:hypothetical protein
VSDQAFTRLMFTLLFLVCACLIVLDQQRQRVLAGMRSEVDIMHGRMNAAGLLDNIRPSVDEPVSAAATEGVFDSFAQFRTVRNGSGDGQSAVEQALTARSNDQLHHIAEGETQ